MTTDAGLMSRLQGGFPWGGFQHLEVLGNLMRALHPGAGGSPQQSAESKVPHAFDITWTHPYEERPGFTHSVIEPPVDLDTYFEIGRAHV